MVRIGTQHNTVASAAAAPVPVRAPAKFQIPTKFKQVLYDERQEVSLPTLLDDIAFKKPMSQKEAKAAAAKAKAAAPEEVKEYSRIEMPSKKPEIKGKGKPAFSKAAKAETKGESAPSKPAKAAPVQAKGESVPSKAANVAPVVVETKGKSAPSKPAKAAPVQEDGWTVVRY